MSHLDLSLSCLCGGAVDVVNEAHDPPGRAVACLTCIECGADLTLEVTLTRHGRSRALHDWGTIGTGERIGRIRPVGGIR